VAGVSAYAANISTDVRDWNNFTALTSRPLIGTSYSAVPGTSRDACDRLTYAAALGRIEDQRTLEGGEDLREVK
jgi:hypothetical protein